jgi:hypothetical protein
MAQLTTDAVIPSTGGLVEQTNTSVNIYTGSKLSCGDTKDTTIAKSSTTGVTPSYSYLLAWNYTLNCNGVVPSKCNFTFTGNSSYNGVLMFIILITNGRGAKLLKSRSKTPSPAKLLSNRPILL